MPKPKTIASRTDKNRKKKSKQISVKLLTVQKFEAFNGHRLVFWYEAKSQSSSNKNYRVEFRSSPQQPINVDNWTDFAAGNVPIFANCSCPDFKYRWETVLHKKNMARLKTSNGDMPEVTNPTQRLSYCKHILAAFDAMQEYVRRRNFEDIGSVVRKNAR